MSEIPEYVTAAVKECVTAAVCAAMKTEIVQECVIAAVCAAMKTEIVQECVTSAVYAAMKETSTTTTITYMSRATNRNYPRRPLERLRYRNFNGISNHKRARDESSDDSPHRPVKRFKSSLASTPAASLGDMPPEIILLIADRTDIGTLNSLSRVCKVFSVLLKCHRDKDAELLRAVEKGHVDDLKTILQSPSATARGGSGLLAKVVKEHLIDLDSMYYKDAFSSVEGVEGRRERLSRTVALVRVLLEAGADIDGCDKGGLTALHWAARCDDPLNDFNTGVVDLVRLLLHFGADVNSMGTIGVTPLHYAVLGGPHGSAFPIPGIINSLIEAGANVHGKDKHDLTPLRLAALHRTGDAAFDVLENAGAVINIDGSRGYPLSPMCSVSCFYHYHDSSCQVPRELRVYLDRPNSRGERMLTAYGTHPMYCDATVCAGV